MGEKERALDSESLTVGGLSRVIRQSGVYALGNVTLKLAGLVLAPFYLNPAYLSLKSYGYFALLNVSSQLGIFVIGLGLGTGMLRFMTQEKYRNDRTAIPYTAFLATLLVAGAAVVLIWLGSAPIASMMLDSPGGAGLVRLLALYVGFKVIAAIPMMLLRIQERPGRYATVMASEVIILIGAVYVLLVWKGEGLEGVMQAFVLSSGVTATALIIDFLFKIRWHFQVSLVRPLVKYGAPLVMAGLAGWFLNVGDRYLLKWLADPEAIGIYDWSARLGGVVNMLFVQSFQLAFTVIGLKSLGVGDQSIHRRMFRHYVIWTGWAVLGLSLLTFDLMNILVAHFGVDRSYLEADVLVLPVALGFMTYGIYVLVNNVLYAEGATSAIGLIVLVAALFNAGLNMLLIPLFGPMGAALTTWCAYLLLVILSVGWSRRFIRIVYPWWTYFFTTFLIVGLYGLGRFTLDWEAPNRLLAHLGLILAYLPLVLVGRLYSREEVLRAWFALRKWINE